MADEVFSVVRRDLKISTTGQRSDGRPQAYDLPERMQPSYVCSVCTLKGRPDLRYSGGGDIVMLDPADTVDGRDHHVCRDHLPEDIVIFNPVTAKCRDFTGENVWSEEVGPGPGTAVSLSAIVEGVNPQDPPDRLSSDPDSPHFQLGGDRLRVFLDDEDVTGEIAEYCVSEGWVRKVVRDVQGEIKTYKSGKSRKPVAQRAKGVVRVEAKTASEILS